MKNDIRQQAQELYYQSGLSKSQIAAALGVSRRSLHYWIKEGNWDRLKASAEHMPSILAEKCYHIFSQTADSFLSEQRLTNPISHKEADTLYKLMLTIKQLKNRNTVSESMEMFALFQDRVKKENPKLAEEITPFIEEHLTARAAVTTGHILPEGFTPMGRLPFDHVIDTDEMALDNKDLCDWAIEQMGDTDYFSQPLSTPIPTAIPHNGTTLNCGKPASYPGCAPTPVNIATINTNHNHHQIVKSPYTAQNIPQSAPSTTTNPNPPLTSTTKNNPAPTPTTGNPLSNHFAAPRPSRCAKNAQEVRKNKSRKFRKQLKSKR
jgi:transposase-like protein